MTFPEKYRITIGAFASEKGESGAFQISKKTPLRVVYFHIIASNGEGWDHVSVTLGGLDKNRCPKWEEMCWIKDLFFDKSETVVQYHPPESEYVNNHKYCLHLWRKHDYDYPLPPSIMVGFK